jgi:hypothetical protein
MVFGSDGPQLDLPFLTQLRADEAAARNSLRIALRHWVRRKLGRAA